jgi:hypothetical protein
MAERIRLSRARGWRLPAKAVVVARPSKWGNPFIVGKHGTRAECAAKFLQLARGFISFSDDVDVDLQRTVYRRIRRHVADLAGKDLACWCKLDGCGCHADVLLLLANPGSPVPAWLQEPGVTLPRFRLGMAAWDMDRHQRKAKTKAGLAKPQAGFEIVDAEQ